MELIKYDAACRAVAEAKTVDEAKEFINRSEALRAYAKQAKNRGLEIDAAEIRVRAERRIGEIKLEMKANGALAVQGTRDSPTRPIRLSELGIDGNLSAISERLALLPKPKLESELQAWRTASMTSRTLTTPLQHYRSPSRTADRAREAMRHGRVKIDSSDPFDVFRFPDGRRAVDVRYGELARVKQLAQRVVRCIEAFEEQMPVANADSLSTIEMIFRAELLLALLNGVWEIPVDCGDAGLNRKRIDEARARRTRQCESCGVDFVAHNPSGQSRAGKSKEGRFCSRECLHSAMRVARKDAGNHQTEVTAGR